MHCVHVDCSARDFPSNLHLPWISSDSVYLSSSAGSLARPRGSNPKDPGTFSRYAGVVDPVWERQMTIIQGVSFWQEETSSADKIQRKRTIIKETNLRKYTWEPVASLGHDPAAIGWRTDRPNGGPCKHRLLHHPASHHTDRSWQFTR